MQRPESKHIESSAISNRIVPVAQINIEPKRASIMTRENLSIHLVERPKDEIIPGQTFNAKTSPAPSPADLKDGQILVEVLYLSLDPALRAQLNGKHSD